MRKVTFILFGILFAATAALAQEGTTARLTAPVSRGEFPLSLGDRPLVLPHLMLEGTTGVEYVKLNPSLNATQIGLRAGFGILDRGQVDVFSGIFVDPDQEWSKTLAGRIAFLAYDSRDLDIAPSVLVPFDFQDGADLVSEVRIGAETRYRFNRMIYVFGLRDFVYFLNVPTSATQTQWQVGLNGLFGVGYSPIDRLSLELQANLFHLKLAGDVIENRVIFGDDIPVGLKALVAVNRWLDVYGQVMMVDLKNGADSMTFFGGLNARL